MAVRYAVIKFGTRIFTATSCQNGCMIAPPWPTPPTCLATAFPTWRYLTIRGTLKNLDGIAVVLALQQTNTF